MNRRTYKRIHERHCQLRKLTDSLIITAKIPREISSDTARHVVRFFFSLTHFMTSTTCYSGMVNEGAVSSSAGIMRSGSSAVA